MFYKVLFKKIRHFIIAIKRGNQLIIKYKNTLKHFKSNRGVRSREPYPCSEHPLPGTASPRWQGRG